MMLAGNCPLALGEVIFSQRALLAVLGSLMMLVGIVHLSSEKWSFLKECCWWNPPSLLREDR